MHSNGANTQDELDDFFVKNKQKDAPESHFVIKVNKAASSK